MGKMLATLSLLLALAVLAPQAVRAEETTPTPAPAAPAAQTAPTPEAAPTLAQRLDQADKLFEQRNQTGNDRKSLDILLALEKEDPNNFEVIWRVARGAYWVGEQAVDRGDLKTAEKFGDLGYKAGLKATQLKPGRVEGYYWAAAALGQYSKGIGLWKAFWKGISGKYTDLCDKAIKIDKKHNMAGPLRTIGRYWYSLPDIKRDLKKSLTHLQEAVSLFPQKLRNQAYLADTLLDDGQKDKAVAHYQLCAAGDPGKEEVADGLKWKAYCQKKLKDLSAGK